MTVEKILADLTGRNIFVLHAAQAGPKSWTVTLVVPGDWYYRRGVGGTLAEALDKARTEALKLPPVHVSPKQAKKRVRLAESPRKKRVRLTGRVRLG